MLPSPISISDHLYLFYILLTIHESPSLTALSVWNWNPIFDTKRWSHYSIWFKKFQANPIFVQQKLPAGWHWLVPELALFDVFCPYEILHGAIAPLPYPLRQRMHSWSDPECQVGNCKISLSDSSLILGSCFVFLPSSAPVPTQPNLWLSWLYHSI